VVGIADLREIELVPPMRAVGPVCIPLVPVLDAVPNGSVVWVSFQAKMRRELAGSATVPDPANRGSDPGAVPSRIG
jgi:hypothetical protein